MPGAGMDAQTDIAKLLKGQGRFTGDIRLNGALHLAFVRADAAPARIAVLDLAEAAGLPGIVGVHGGPDVAHLGRLEVNRVLQVTDLPEFPVLAQGRVEAVGQPLAAVLGTSRAAALDGAEAVRAELEEAEFKPLEVARQSWGAPVDAALAASAHVVEAQVSHARLAPMSLEGRAIAVLYEEGSIIVWLSTQTPHRARAQFAKILGVAPEIIRVIAPNVGGAFGLKGSVYPEEVFAVWAALHHKRSVIWQASRSEEFLSGSHGRGITTRGALGLDADGRITALRARAEAPLGHWMPNSALIPAWNAMRILPGPYAVPEVDVGTSAKTAATAATGIYRGAGRPEAAALMERLMDKAAQATGLDPFEIRSRNLLPSSAMPYMSKTGQTFDSGDYSAALSRLRAVSGFDARLKAAQARRAQGALVGLGIAMFLEPSGEGWESARVTWDAGGVTVASGSSGQGQGRAAAYARIAAAALDVPEQSVSVHYGDTGTCPEGIGALASRSTSIGGSAVLEACRALKAKVDAGAALPLTEDIRYETQGQAWGYGSYLAQISVDADTGAPRVEAAICVDDAGRIIDAAAVHGQIMGGFAQGLGEALMERIVYDSDGQLLTASLMDYAVPRADDMPPMVLDALETPSPMNPLGAKGVGEAGTIGAPAAILNAALDALAPVGVTDLQMPLSAHRLWEAMQAVKMGDASL